MAWRRAGRSARSASLASVMSVSDPASRRRDARRSSLTAAPRQRIQRIRAVAMQDPMLAFEVAARRSRDMRSARRARAPTSSWMDPREPLVGPTCRFPARRSPSIAFQRGDQYTSLRGEVPVPEAVVRAAHRERVALFALAQVVDRPLVRQVRLDARERDREVDRLGDVVVGAEPKRFDDVGALRSARSP